MNDSGQHRLSLHVTPSAYRLDIDADLLAATFTGTVEVDVTIVGETSELRCNACGLEIGETTVLVGGQALAGAVAYQPLFETIGISVATPIGGAATVRIAFSGRLNDELRGFYRSTYIDDDGTEHTLGVTQMEANWARRVFPCWDQPDMKATFEIGLTVDADHMVVSNTAPLGEEPTAAGRRHVRFAPTIPMSTYLVAWVIGRLEASDPIDVEGFPVRVVHRPGQSHLAGFALDVARFAIPWFQQYYGIRYPGDKIDLVALPDFASGAMENLGCITFREVLLLVDPDRANQIDLQEVADVVNHELAHMWFGDLVTMRWWNGLWLNEAFATFMETAATDAFRPDWDRWSNFSLSKTSALEIDGLASTRPIEYPVVTPADADDMFDVLTYHKGSAVLRMLEQYLGPDRFREGIGYYLERHSFSNTDTHDLWDALEHVTGEPVRLIMDSWIFRGGYPCIEIAAISATSLRLSQVPFGYSSQSGDASWLVPVRLRDAEGTVTSVLVADEPVTVVLSAPLVTANAGASGFYRCVTPGPLLDLLDPVERYALLDDQAAMTLAGRATTASLLDVVDRLRHDDDLVVWQRIHSVLESVGHLVDDRALWNRYVRQLVGPALESLGHRGRNGENDRTRERRAVVLTLAGAEGADPAVIEMAREVLLTPDADPALSAAAITIVSRTGGPAEWTDLRRRVGEAENPQDAERLQRALAQFPDEGLTLRLCELCLTDEVRSQDAPFLLRQALRNRDGGPAAWRFLTDHWPAVVERLPPVTMHRVLDGIRWLSQPGDAVAVEAFVATHPLEVGGRQVTQHLERLRIHTDWRARAGVELPEYLAARAAPELVQENRTA